MNLLRSVRVVMDTLDDTGSAKEVAQAAVAAFRLKAEELSEDPPKQELAEQRHSTYLAAVRDVRANTYKILGDALCIPSSPVHRNRLHEGRARGRAIGRGATRWKVWRSHRLRMFAVY